MLSDEELEGIAQEHVRKAYPADCEILHREKRSHPDGIYFVANRRTAADLAYIGDGGFFVSRGSGEIWKFGSGQLFHEGLDYWLQWYAEGWRPGPYRLTLRKVKLPGQFARLLLDHRVSYAVLELEHDVVWHREVEYDEKCVLDRIKELPCSFLVDGQQLRAMIPELERMVVFEYSHIGDSPKHDWHPENYTKEQLGPQWE